MIGGFHFAAPAPPLLSVRASPMVPSIHDRLLSYCLFVCVTYVAMTKADNEAARAAGLFIREACRIVRRQIVWQKKIKLEFQTDDIKDLEID